MQLASHAAALLEDSKLLALDSQLLELKIGLLKLNRKLLVGTVGALGGEDQMGEIADQKTSRPIHQDNRQAFDLPVPTDHDGEGDYQDKESDDDKPQPAAVIKDCLEAEREDEADKKIDGRNGELGSHHQGELNPEIEAGVAGVAAGEVGLAG